jgi:hypothetical protein
MKITKIILLAIIISILNADIFNLEKGWNLVGISSSSGVIEFNKTFNNSNIGIIWGYKNGEWYGYSPDENTQKLITQKGFNLFKEISGNRGFWIYAKDALIIDTDQGVIIPIYFYNNDDTNKWEEVINIQSEAVVIINPFNGPGNEIDENYVTFINDLINNSKKPIGYVHTQWGERDIELVKKDIDTWLQFYPKIQGFFIDEASESITKIDYYKDIYNYIKSKGNYFIVLNVGTMPNESYFSIADNIVVYEGDVKNLPNEACKSYAYKSSIIVYGADEDKMKEIISTKPCMYIYITDDNDSMPYDSLPSYFDEEIELLK